MRRRDEVPDERQRGIDAGLAWRGVADATVAYTDMGVTPGMEYGIAAAREAGLPVEFRCLDTWRPLAEAAEKIVATLDMDRFARETLK